MHRRSGFVLRLRPKLYRRQHKRRAEDSSGRVLRSAMAPPATSRVAAPPSTSTAAGSELTRLREGCRGGSADLFRGRAADGPLEAGTETQLVIDLATKLRLVGIDERDGE